MASATAAARPAAAAASATISASELYKLRVRRPPRSCSSPRTSLSLPGAPRLTALSRPAPSLACPQEEVAKPFTMTSGSFARGDIAQLREKAKERKGAMQALDMAKLKAKAASGAMEGEFVEHLAKKLSVGIAQSAAAVKFLAEERKAQAVLEVRRQLEIKAERAEAERQRAADEQLALVERLQTEQRKAEARAAEQAAVRARVTRDIRAQLADNEYRKIMEVEFKEQEAALLARAAAAAAEKEAALQLQKKADAVAQGKEIAEANRRFAVRDEVRRQREEEDAQAIIVFQLEKAAKAAHAEKLLAAEKKEKDRIAAEQLASMKKAMDNSAAEDEAKARRHVEAAVLRERERAAAYAAKVEASRLEMIASVARQLELKEIKAHEEKVKEAETVARIQREMAEHIQREAGHHRDVRERTKAAQRMLVEQKEQRLADKAMEQKRPLEERRQQLLWEAAEQQAIDGFRAEVAGRMVKANAPGNFLHKVKELTIDHGKLHE